MHQEIECPESEWGEDYVLGEFKKARTKLMNDCMDQLDKHFWAPGPEYQAAKDADAQGLVTDRCEWKEMGFGIEFYVSQTPSK